MVTRTFLLCRARVSICVYLRFTSRVRLLADYRGRICKRDTVVKSFHRPEFSIGWKSHLIEVRLYRISYRGSIGIWRISIKVTIVMRRTARQTSIIR